MPAGTPNRLGQINDATGSWAADNALFLKVFSGMVLASFVRKTVMRERTMLRQIPHGKSAQFPVVGRAVASRHTPGAYIKGQSIKHAERLIHIDDLLISPVEIAEIDELKNHYDVRSQYAMELGDSLAQVYDSNLIKTAILAARANATITGGEGGIEIEKSDADTNAQALAAALFQAAQRLDENHVPEEDRYALVRPAQYYLLVQNTDTINKNWGGAGAYSDGKILRIAGLSIVKTTNIPNSLVQAAAGENNSYNGDYTGTVASVFHKSAVGTVSLMSLKTATEWSERLQTTLMLAKMAVGHGILRPEAAVEINNGDED
jgi:hypothetical protein